MYLRHRCVCLLYSGDASSSFTACGVISLACCLYSDIVTWRRWAERYGTSSSPLVTFKTWEGGVREGEGENVCPHSIGSMILNCALEIRNIRAGSRHLSHTCMYMLDIWTNTRVRREHSYHIHNS